MSQSPRGPRAPRARRPPVLQRSSAAPEDATARRQRRIPDPRIVHEDDDLCVIEKPAGMLSMRVDVKAEGLHSAFEWLREREPERRDPDHGLWLVHRLDREVSGLLVFARSRRAFHWLKEDLRGHRMQRRYIAVVDGALPPGRTGSIEGFLTTAAGRVHALEASTYRGRTPGPEDETAQARFARTHYRVLSSGQGYSLLELTLDTGRRHQIRAHLQSIGHPVAGDRVYGGTRAPRLCLHAATLSFEHPGTGRTLEMETPVPGLFFKLLGESVRTGLERMEREAAREARPERASRPERAPAAATSWEPVADWYDSLIDERGNDHYRDVVMPGTLRLLGAEGGQRVLDVACGQGVLCRELADLGVDVTGVDASPRLIELARKRLPANSRRAPRYAIADARELKGLEAEPFDAVSLVLCLMNIDPLEPVLRGCAARLRPGGVLVAVLTHPAFRAPRQTSWGWDQKSDGRPHQYRRVDGYLSEGRVRIVANPGAVARGEPAIETWSFHRPIEHYVRSLAEAGFAIERLEEWPSARRSQPGPRAAEENRARREIPLFLGLRARRS